MIQIDKLEVNYSQFDRRQVRSAMGRAARAMAANLKRQVSGGGGSGRTYRRRGSDYTASAPGQPPGRLSGGLMRSMRGRPSRRGYAAVVSALAPHAHLLELGWRHAAPRPYFGPTFGNQELIVSLLRAAYEKAAVAVPGQPGRPPKTVEIN